MMATVLIGLGGMAYAMDKQVTLPNQETIQKRFHKAGLPFHSSRIMPLIQTFADKTMTLSEIESTATAEFKKAAEQPEAKGQENWVVRHAENNRPKVYAALLKKYPDELEVILKNNSAK